MKVDDDKFAPDASMQNNAQKSKSEFNGGVANNYQLIGKEISRLCSIQKKLFKDALDLPHIFEEKKDVNPAPSKGKDYFEKIVKNIENELQKVDKMEVVIAIVGTMKAGKSTTINAIVGTEVLPNRNAPMTTLPTIIRNKHGQAKPVMTLNKVRPLEKISEEIAQKISKLDIKKLALYNSKDGKELIDSLLQNRCYPFKYEYKGQKEIFSFLKHLNDLMRLAKEPLIDIAPPFEEYENLDDLPCIEIEFFHLRGKADDAQGSLAILDTPGPNEYGQSEALRNVFVSQLEKASAVGLIIDYTQMKSTSEGEVRSEVLKVITEQLSKESLYLLVNKFDQANSNSMNKEEVIEYVIEALMDKTIESSQVYPISAQQAYLANRAKHHLATSDKFPDFHTETWVADFAKAAMGEFWEEDVHDIGRAQKCAERLWERSHFNEPLEGIFEKAHAKAAEKSVKSAAKKLHIWHQDLDNTCRIIKQSIITDIDKINGAIKALEDDVTEFKETKNEISHTTEDGLKELSSALNQLAEKHQKDIESEIKRFFDEGKEREKKSIDDAIRQDARYLTPKKGSFQDLFQFVLAGGSYDYIEEKRQEAQAETEKLFEPNNPAIPFRNKDEAEGLINSISKSVKNIYDDLSKQFKDESTLIASKMAADISANINTKATAILEQAQKQLSDSGFQLNLSIPELSLTMNSFDVTTSLGSGIYTKTESGTYRRRTSSIWGTFCGWFDTDDWGKEVVEYTKKSYLVNTHQIRDMIINQLNDFKNNHTLQFKAYVTDKFEPTINKHIDGLSDYMELYCDWLEKGKITNQLEQEMIKELDKRIEQLLMNVQVQTNDLKVVEEWLL